MDTSNPTAWDTALYDEKHSFVWKRGAALIELLAPGRASGCSTWAVARAT